jgi:VRR-NUC domain
LIPYQMVDGKIINNKFLSRDEDELALNKQNMPEHWEQCQLLNWLRSQPIKQLNRIFAIPNAGNRHPGYAAKMAQEGLTKGVPDLLLPVARGGYHGLFVEMKRRRGGKLSPEQKQKIADFSEEGYCCVVTKGYHQAIRSIVSYLIQ